jgi:hypothetical protein
MNSIPIKIQVEQRESRHIGDARAPVQGWLGNARGMLVINLDDMPVTTNANSCLYNGDQHTPLSGQTYNWSTTQCTGSLAEICKATSTEGGTERAIAGSELRINLPR